MSEDTIALNDTIITSPSGDRFKLSGFDNGTITCLGKDTLISIENRSYLINNQPQLILREKEIKLIKKLRRIEKIKKTLKL